MDRQLGRNGSRMKSPLHLQHLVLTTRFMLMERAISASDANQRFSELLREVSEGESFTVMSRGRAVARVLPIDRGREQRSIRNLLDFVSGLPIRHAGNWSRDDIYE